MGWRDPLYTEPRCGSGAGAVQGGAWARASARWSLRCRLVSGVAAVRQTARAAVARGCAPFLCSARNLNSSLYITQRMVLHGVRASERGAGSFLAQQDLAQL